MKVKNLDIPEKIKQDFLSEGIEKLNPPQEKAVNHGVLEGEDMIVASPTASGKTFIAELAITEKVVNNTGTAVYIVPLKALASEKYEDFTERFEDQEVMMAVGDKDDDGGYLETADIIVVTSEKLDSILRHNPDWITQIDLVTVDEIHLLTSPNRGPTLEVTLTRLRDILDFQLLGLSATISNSSEMAEWLEAELVESDYRPVDLSHGIYWDNEIEFYSGESSNSSNNEESRGFTTGKDIKDEGEKEEETESLFIEDLHGRGVPNITEDTLEKDKQEIVFCSSRKGAEKSSDRLAKVVEPEISRQEKRELEEYGERIENVLGSPTSQCKRLAENVSKGSAFHHAGLCVSGDSMILHPDGTFSRMDHLIENDTEKALGLSEYKINENQIEEKYEFDEKPVLEISTGTGRKLKVSENHQLPLLDEEGIIWRKSKNLKEGDRIATPRKLNVNTDTPNLRELLRDEVRTYRKYDKIRELAKKVNLDQIEGYRDRYSKDRNISVGGLRKICEKADIDPNNYLDEVMSKGGNKPVKIPEKLDQDISWLIGSVAGDGYIDGHSVRLSGSCEEIKDRFQKTCKEKFGRNTVEAVRDDGVWTLALGSKAITDILRDYFGIPEGEKSRKLRMPETGLPDQLLASYIRGLFDTDGSVNCRQNEDGASCIEFYTASRELATELHTSLLRFGIIAHRDKRDTEGRVTTIGEDEIHTKGDIHRILIYGSDQLKKYKEQIGFTHPCKESKLDEAIKINPEGGRRQNDVIPKALGTKVRKVRNKKRLSLSDLEPEVPKSTVSRFENHRNPIKRETFQVLAEELENRELKAIAKSDIYWDKITEIKKKEPEKLYDISTSTENFIANGIIAHNTSEQRQLVEEAFKKGLIKTISATPTLAAGVNLPAFRVIIRDLKRYTGQGMEYIPVLEYEQMTGRAGRPKYDDHGEAISVAKNSGMKSEILERYIQGEPEKIQSKLNAEPTLRMHTLSLIASSFCTSMVELKEFYSKTFFAHQYGDLAEVEVKIEEVISQLRSYGFVKEDDLRPTSIGKRVSELYLDPDSAHHIIKSLERSEGEETRPISYLFMLSRTTEMKPRLRVKEKEYQDIGQEMMDAEPYLLEAIPSEWDPEYDIYLEAMKTAMMMQGWISEVDEERLMDKYGIAPGGIRAKTSNADWLLYASKELARMKKINLDGDIEKLRLRLQYGIEEELLKLVKFDQIGRVRARKLQNANIKDAEDIREAEFEKIKRLIGERTARKLKKQVGEENIFDRENIMDYFE